MAVSDIPGVMVIDGLAFTAPWKASGYEYEITANQLAHYQILAWHQPQSQCLVGYVGHWLLTGEAHISTLAVHPDWQRLGLGEALLLAALSLANNQGAHLSTLEVRRSNVAAQHLYANYRFAQVGVRRRYYRDNGEDALILTSPPFDAAYAALLQERVTAVTMTFNQLRPSDRPCVQVQRQPTSETALESQKGMQ